MLYYHEIDVGEEINIAKSINIRNVQLFTVGVLIISSNFKILYAIIAIIERCCVLI